MVILAQGPLIPWQFTMAMLAVNVAAKTLDLQMPAAFIDDNIHVDVADKLETGMPKYWAHMDKEGFMDKQ